MVETIFHRKNTTYNGKDRPLRLSYEKAGRRR